jgi:H+/Cl- antiporter ClcA
MLLALLTGVPAGLASALFLLSLDWVTSLRLQHPFLLFLLPLVGLASVYLYRNVDQEIAKGNNALLEQVQTPSHFIPWRMAPVVYVATLLGHLGGASVGREGTAVQMSGALNDLISRWLRLSSEDRKMVLQCAISAGFSSVFGTPLAGALFGLEVPKTGSFSWKRILPALLASYTAHWLCLLFPVHHSHFSISSTFPFSFTSFGWIVGAAFIFGLLANSFQLLSDWIKSFWKRTELNPYAVVGIAAVMMVPYFYWVEDSSSGLGFAVIQSSFIQNSLWYLCLLKLFFTALSLQSGFKGGEVTPLFFIGATCGSALAGLSPFAPELLAALGFAAVFGAATKTPLASTVMGIELFGLAMALPLFFSCALAFYFSGPQGIYSAQQKSNRIPFFSLDKVWEKFSATK